MVRQFGRPAAWRFPNYTARMPEHYYKYIRQLEKPSERVHEIIEEKNKGQYLDYVKDEKTGFISRVADVPIKVDYPKATDEGLWGGEGIIKGFIKPRKYFLEGKIRHRVFFPNLCRCVFHSEILDQYFNIVCTRRTLDLVDQAFGFDAYILRTPVQNFKSQLACDLRHLMLLKLAKKDFADKAKGEELCSKYKDCILPVEEAEWFGLSHIEATNRFKVLDARETKPVPMKVKFAQELIEELKRMKETGELSEMIEEEDKESSIIGKIKSKLSFSAFYKNKSQ